MQSHNGWYTWNRFSFFSSILAKAAFGGKFERMAFCYTIDTTKSKNIVLILAGNIPLVGFHDFLRF
jgi:hypothetical protein